MCPKFCRATTFTASDALTSTSRAGCSHHMKMRTMVFLTSLVIIGDPSEPGPGVCTQTPKRERERAAASEKRGERERARFYPGASEKNNERVKASDILNGPCFFKHFTFHNKTCQKVQLNALNITRTTAHPSRDRPTHRYERLGNLLTYYSSCSRVADADVML